MKLQQLLFNGLLGLALITASCIKKDDSISTTTCLPNSYTTSLGIFGDETTTYTRNAAGAFTRKHTVTAYQSITTDCIYSTDGLTVTLTSKNDSTGKTTDTIVRTLNSSKYITKEVSAYGTTTNTYDASGYLATKVVNSSSSSDTTFYSYTNGNRTMERTKSDTVFYTYGSDVVPPSTVPADGFDGKPNTNLWTTKKTKYVTATITYEKNSNGYPTKTTFSVPAHTTGSNTYPAISAVTTFTYTCQ